MAIEVGDAVLKFLGDSTQLDAAFDSVGPKASAAFDPASEKVEELEQEIEKLKARVQELGDELEDAGHRTSSSMHEATAEVGLLGEEFGIRLPRHVRAFVAEIPGVGTALSAAFSATAILFLVQALVEATEKVSNFISATLIYSAAQKAQTAEIIRQNILIAQQGELYTKAKDKLFELSDQRTQMQKLTDTLTDLNKQYDELATDKRTPSDVLDAKARALEEEIKLTEKQIALQKEADEKESNKKALEALKQQITLEKDLTLAAVAYHQAENQGNAASDYDEVRYQIKLAALQKEKAAQQQFNADNLAGIEALNNQIQVLEVERGTKILEELNKERENLLKNLQAMGKDIVGVNQEITAPINAVAEALIIQKNAANSLGITIKGQLVSAYNQAVGALNAYKDAGGKDAVVIEDFKRKIEEADNAVKHFGVDMDKFAARSENTWKNFQQDMKNGAQFMQNFAQLGKEAFNSMAAGLQSAISAALLGQESFSKAIEKATESALASLASQAIVKALFYTAEGVAALAMQNYGGAGQYFTAAGEMAAVGAAAGLAAHAMAGAGGGSSNTQQSATTNSNTGQSNRTGGGATIGIQALAEGGLVTSPTLALVGESGREAVIPLDDPRTKSAMGGSGVGGDVHHHWSINGMISSDNMAKVMKTMSKMVSRGQASLTASNSLRLTKRSA
jgi:hypothetical protein